MATLSVIGWIIDVLSIVGQIINALSVIGWIIDVLSIIGWIINALSVIGWIIDALPSLVGLNVNSYVCVILCTQCFLKLQVRPSLEPDQLGVYKTGFAQILSYISDIENSKQTWSFHGSSNLSRKLQV